jgi:hypothetical protein
MKEGVAFLRIVLTKDGHGPFRRLDAFSYAKEIVGIFPAFINQSGLRNRTTKKS